MTFVARRSASFLAFALAALCCLPARARLVQVQRTWGKVWISVPEPAGTKLPRPTARAAPFRDAIARAADRCSVDARLVEAIIACESDFDVHAVSAAGAMGLMQLMPDTADALGVIDAFDAEENIDGGTRHLAGLLRSFEGDRRLAVAAYNAGETTVRRADGIPRIPETVHYVRKVENYLALLGSSHPPADVDAPVAEMAVPEPAPPEGAPVQRGHRVVMARDAQGRLVFVNSPGKGGP